MPDINSLSLEGRDIGGAPVVRHFFDRLGLDQLIATYVPERKLGRKRALPTARALSVMVSNALLSREPLYGVPEWVDRFVLEPFGLTAPTARLFNDDRIGRALDGLYAVDPASFLTAVITKAVQEFEIDLDQIHNDTTTVTFSGAYEGQADPEQKKRPPIITFGHNKDHRPDLKQLVYALTISADGAVPVHYKTYDGNITDDQTHRETWTTVCKLKGNAEFTYVADSKLCTRENMAFIHERGGRFLTVLPRSRKEDDDFREHLRDHHVEWQEVFRKKSRRGRKIFDVYKAHEPETRTAEGYRIVWYHSSIKEALDQKRRSRRIKRARQRLRELEARSGAHRFRSLESAEKAAREVLQDEGAERWLDVTVTEQTVGEFKQTRPGRPGKNTPYRKVEIPVILFEVKDRGDTIQMDARCDGVFAMVTNLDEPSAKELLAIYKYQPFLEKRNEQLKSVLSVAPVFLKKPERVAALLFVYFLAVLIFALIERELRRRMAEEGIQDLPLYPEGRACKAPTADLVLRAVEGLRRSRLIAKDGTVVRTFYDEVKPAVRQVLRLLGVDLRAYGLGGKD